MACVPSFPVNAFAFPEFITIAIGSSSFLDALFTTFFDQITEGALVLEFVKTPVTILPASRRISVKSSRSLYFIFAHKEENLAPLIINFLLLEKSIFFIYF